MISLESDVNRGFPMINNPYQAPAANIQVTWKAMLWRLLLTALLLLTLLGSNLTIFRSVTTQPDAHVLPTLTQETEGR